MTTQTPAEKLQEFVDQARGNPKLSRFTTLINAFESCLHAVQEQKTRPNDPNLRQGVRELYSIFWKEMVFACNSMGTNPSTLRTYLDNPENFTTKEWEEIVRFQEEFRITKAAPSKKSKKARTQKQKMRI